MSTMRKGRLVSYDYFNEECGSAAAAGLQNKFKVVGVKENFLGDSITLQHYDYPNLIVEDRPKNVTFCNVKKPSLDELKEIYTNGVPERLLTHYGYAQPEPA